MVVHVKEAERAGQGPTTAAAGGKPPRPDAEKAGGEAKAAKPLVSAGVGRFIPAALASRPSRRFTRFASFPPFFAGPLMFSRFFIDRPIFASVLSIVIAWRGGLAM